MAQTFLEPFSVSGMDCQTAVAVQSLLESTVSDASPIDEEDVFQCGKCKKQFTSLGAFVNHKQSRCVTQKTIQQLTNAISSAVNTVPVSSNLMQNVNKGPQLIQTSYAPQTSITQLPQNMVLTDDLMSFANVDTSAIQLASTLQSAGPFLSQVATFTSRSPNNVTILSPVTTSLPSSGSAFTSTVHSTNQIHLQPVQQQITLTTLPEKPIAPNMGNIAKPSPTKAGRKSAQASLVTVVSADSLVKLKRSKNGNMVLDEKKKLRCNYCDKTFAKNFDLNQHVRAHTGEKPFQCIVCGRAFAQKSNVKKHMATHKVWPAGAGSTLPNQPSPLLIEEDEEPPLDSSLDPPPSEELNQNQLMTHEDSLAHVTDVPQVVVLDNNPIVDPTVDPCGLQDSEQMVDDKQPSDDAENTKVKVVVDNSYLCQYCCAKFRTYFQLKTHMVHHKDQQVYKCVVKECQDTFKDLDSFLEHIKSHDEDMSYRCHMCNKFFPTLYDLGVHQYTHSLYPNQGIKPGPRHFQCTKCMNKYSTPEALEHHLATSTHNHSCPHCEKTFTCERYLRRHLPSHGSEGQFQCPTCEKRFKGEHYLKMHMLIHSGEKPFQCDVCSASFNRKDKLKRHMLIHDSNKRYRCPFKALTGCQKEFNRPDKLKSHILTHSGIKPYKCRECGRSFGRKPHLREHERGHRADFKFKCETCGKGFFRPKLFQSHKCHPLKPGQAHVFKPRNKRKVGRPKKRVPSEAEGVRVENTMTLDNKEEKSSTTPDATGDAHNVIVQEENVRNGSGGIYVNEQLVVGLNDHEQGGQLSSIPEKRVSRSSSITSSSKKPDFCVKVSAPPPVPPAVAPRYVTVHIQNSNTATGQDIQTHLMPHHSQQLMSHQSGANGSMQPITIIEAQHVPMHLPMMTGLDNSIGEPITMQMATVSGAESLAQSVAAVGGVVSELIPVAVAMQDNSDSMVATQVVVTSNRASDQGYITSSASLEDYGTPDGDLVLQGTDNLLKAHTDMYHSAQQ
ncbi:zinc finger protein 341-like isoform X3 [Mizuhopecten yessoensis]|uniref:zinc finger protein 341-like isoform X3 n=1 Tax=Mizuhopecten yessoensis TaxID=6573 RepID=UPI000B45ABC7|nr:zinc finger protein 341-like isoform X3 [Mizuhopecten yessoensis]